MAIEDGKLVGVKRGARIKKRWNPKSWKPEYELIVAASATGMSNVTLAEKFGFTKEHISNILNCEEAKKIQAQILGRLRQQSLEDVPTQLARARVLAAKRVLNVLENDTLATNSPMAIFDRSLQTLRFTQPGGDPESIPGSVVNNTVINNNVQQNNFTLLTERAKNLHEGLAAALEVEKLHAGTEFITGASGDLRESKEGGSEVHAVHNGRVEVLAQNRKK